MYCLVPISTLQASVFNLPWGSSIYAKVIATNAYGNSTLSSETPADRMAIILTNPSPPKGLEEVLASKTTTSIGLKWINGDSNGGASVQNYTVSASTSGS